MIKVLVVEDFPVVRKFLTHILGSDPELQVVGTAPNGEEALEAVRRKKPDVVTMDISMPKMNGFEATRRIMETNPTPIVIVSGNWDTGEVTTTFQAVDSGALAVVRRPAGVGHPDYEATVSELIQTVKLMSEVKVVRRWPRLQREAVATPVPLPAEVKTGRAEAKIKIIAVGASTGGPPALQTILSGLSRDFPVPVLIVQHMAAGFIQGLADWLGQKSALPVHVAGHGEHVLPGHVYIAPDGWHMGVITGGQLVLSKAAPENGLRPSVSYLFRSVAGVYRQNVVGVLLTGMGKDGAGELKLIKEKGAVTIAQDKESSVVYGMPGEAIKLGAATHVLSPEKIPAALMNLVNEGA